jgi:hypothetical protein
VLSGKLVLVTTPIEELGEICQDHQWVTGWMIMVQYSTGTKIFTFSSISEAHTDSQSVLRLFSQAHLPKSDDHSIQANAKVRNM